MIEYTHIRNQPQLSCPSPTQFVNPNGTIPESQLAYNKDYPGITENK